MKHKKEKYIAKTKGGTDTKKEEKKQGSTPMTSQAPAQPRKKLSPTFEGGKMKTIKDAPEEFAREKMKELRKKFTKGRQATASKADMSFMKEGGLAEATAKLKAKGLKEGGMVVKDKVVAIDTSPNSGLITTKGFGAGRKT